MAFNGTLRFRFRDTDLAAYTDNVTSLGTSSLRWSTVYAGSGTINTSDARAKQDVSPLDDAELRVAVAIRGLIRKYRFKDAVTQKGAAARIHVGVMAQDVQSAFEAEGLDPFRYGVLCHDAWEAQAEERDDDGTVTTPAREAGDRYGVRYDELFAFILAVA